MSILQIIGIAVAYAFAVLIALSYMMAGNDETDVKEQNEEQEWYERQRP